MSDMGYELRDAAWEEWSIGVVECWQLDPCSVSVLSVARYSLRDTRYEMRDPGLGMRDSSQT